MNQDVVYRKLDPKFVSQDPVLTEEILRFKINLYLDKLSTGMGVTTLFLYHCTKNVIVLSPFTSMVDIKQQKDTEGKVVFIHGTADGAWGLVEKKIDNSEHVVINATADGFIKLKENKPEIYQKILNYCHIVVDEWHTVFGNTFSKALPKLYEIILETPLPYIVTTGTSIINYLEVPDDVQIMVLDYKVREKKELAIHLCKGEKNETEKSIALHIHDCLKKKLKPAIATNNKKYLKVCPELTRELLAGDAMKAKSKLVTKFDEVTNIGDADVAFFSTKYVPGADFEGDISIHTIADGSFKADSKTTQEIVQAPGRARIGYRNSKLTYKPSEGHRCEKEIISEIQQFDRNKPTYAADTRELFYEFMMAQTYSSVDRLIENLDRYGIDAKIIDEDSDYIDIDEKSTLATSLSNLMKNREVNIERSFVHVLNNIQGDAPDTNLYTDKTVTVYVIWKLVSLGLVDNKRLQQDEQQGQQCRSIPYILRDVEGNSTEVEMCLDWLRVMDSKKSIKKLLKEKKVNPNENKEKARRWILLKSTINNIYKTAFENKLSSLNVDFLKLLNTYSEKSLNNALEDYLKDNKNLIFSDISKNVNRDFNQKLKELNIPHDKFSQDLFNEIGNGIKKAFSDKKLSELNYLLTGNRERYIKQYMNLGKFVFCLKYNLYFTGFKLTKVSNREYNPVVKVPKVLKSLTPIAFIEFDLISANPTIIDLEVGSNIGQNMYRSIMERDGISNKEAKVKYNILINNHKDKRRYSSMVSLGYNDDQAKYLAELGSVKGAIYRLATAKEEELVLDLANENFLHTFARSHDGLICFKELTKLNFPNNVNFNKTHFG